MALSYRCLPWYVDEFVHANDGPFCSPEVDNDTNQLRSYSFIIACMKRF